MKEKEPTIPEIQKEYRQKIGEAEFRFLDQNTRLCQVFKREQIYSGMNENDFAAKLAKDAKLSKRLILDILHLKGEIYSKEIAKIEAALQKIILIINEQ